MLRSTVKSTPKLLLEQLSFLGCLKEMRNVSVYTLTNSKNASHSSMCIQVVLESQPVPLSLTKVFTALFGSLTRQVNRLVECVRDSRPFGMGDEFPNLVVDLLSVDLELRPGEVHALVGENGAGKSTLMKILSGALSPDAGAMTLDGCSGESHLFDWFPW